MHRFRFVSCIDFHCDLGDRTTQNFIYFALFCVKASQYTIWPVISIVIKIRSSFFKRPNNLLKFFGIFDCDVIHGKTDVIHGKMPFGCFHFACLFVHLKISTNNIFWFIYRYSYRFAKLLQNFLTYSLDCIL